MVNLNYIVELFLHSLECFLKHTLIFTLLCTGSGEPDPPSLLYWRTDSRRPTSGWNILGSGDQSFGGSWRGM